jgi:hypothetical protein
MQQKVGLLTRNTFIRGSRAGENSPYTTWNSPNVLGVDKSSVCSNDVCVTEEIVLNCPTDYFGPMYEYGASILVSAYSEDFALAHIRESSLL